VGYCEIGRRARRKLRTLLAAAGAVLLLAVTAIGSLIGLAAECTGSTTECPRSLAYRGTLVAMPLAVAILLLGGSGWSIRKRTVRPLILAEAAALLLVALTDALFNNPDIGTVVLVGLAVVAVRSARDEKPDEAGPG
jgi:hypothetical protein